MTINLDNKIALNFSQFKMRAISYLIKICTLSNKTTTQPMYSEVIDSQYAFTYIRDN